MRAILLAAAAFLAAAACGGGGDSDRASEAMTEAPTTTSVPLGEAVSHQGEEVTVTEEPTDLGGSGVTAKLVAANPHTVGRGSGIDVTVTNEASSDGFYHPEAFDFVTDAGTVLPTVDEWGFAEGDKPGEAMVLPGQTVTATVTFALPVGDVEGGALRLLEESEEWPDRPLASWRFG